MAICTEFLQFGKKETSNDTVYSTSAQTITEIKRLWPWLCKEAENDTDEKMTVFGFTKDHRKK